MSPDAGELFRSFVEQSPHAVLLLDEGGRILEANPAAAQLAGHLVDALVGTDLGSLVEVAEAGAVRAALARSHDHGAQFLDLSLRAADHLRVDLRATLVPGPEDARSSVTLAVLENVTVCRRLAGELEVARALAAAAADARSGFVARTSHEIRTPLTSILSISDLLAETSDPQEQQRLADTLHRSSRRLLHLVDNVLHFAAGETATDPYVTEAFDLHAVIHDAVSLVETSARRKGLTMTLDLGVDVPRVVRDHPTWTSQVLVNLLSNAVNFTEEGGVELSVSFERTTTSGMSVMYRVADTGGGIAPEDEHRIFRPFERSARNGAHPGPTAGVGLGLSIVDQLVRMSGGTVAFTSTVGRGTVFTVIMPVQPVTT